MSTIHELRKLLEAYERARSAEVASFTGALSRTLTGQNKADLHHARLRVQEELKNAMYEALPALLALADAAQELKESAEITLNTYSDGKTYVSYNPHGFGPLAKLMQALSALAPTNPKE